jgi:putative transposase
VPRRLLQGTGGVVFHVMNRATRGQVLFDTPADYVSWEDLLAESQERYRMRILGFCPMPNHWHQLLWPYSDADLRLYVSRVTFLHARQIHRRRGTVGRGAIYQGRYRAVPVETDSYFYRVMSYIERNPVRGGLVDRPEDWPWSSASVHRRTSRVVLTDWPVPRPADWAAVINAEQPQRDVDFIRARTASRLPIALDRRGLADLAVRGQPTAERP